MDDICANNHGGNPRSVDANIRASRGKANQRARIYEEAVAHGVNGAIAEDLYRPLGIGDNSGTARCSELKRDGMLILSGRIGLTLTGADADILVADIHATEAMWTYTINRCR